MICYRAEYMVRIHGLETWTAQWTMVYTKWLGQIACQIYLPDRYTLKTFSNNSHIYKTIVTYLLFIDTIMYMKLTHVYICIAIVTCEHTCISKQKEYILICKYKVCLTNVRKYVPTCMYRYMYIVKILYAIVYAKIVNTYVYIGVDVKYICIYLYVVDFVQIYVHDNNLKLIVSHFVGVTYNKYVNYIILQDYNNYAKIIVKHGYEQQYNTRGQWRTTAV